jgi:hypothetical protein
VVSVDIVLLDGRFGKQKFYEATVFADAEGGHFCIIRDSRTANTAHIGFRIGLLFFESLANMDPQYINLTNAITRTQ